MMDVNLLLNLFSFREPKNLTAEKIEEGVESREVDV